MKILLLYYLANNRIFGNDLVDFPRNVHIPVFMSEENCHLTYVFIMSMGLKKKKQTNKKKKHATGYKSCMVYQVKVLTCVHHKFTLLHLDTPLKLHSNM